MGLYFSEISCLGLENDLNRKKRFTFGISSKFLYRREKSSITEKISRMALKIAMYGEDSKISKIRQLTLLPNN